MPCIHVAERTSYKRYSESIGIPVTPGGEGTGMIDHVAFNTTDFDGMLARLRGLGLEPKMNLLDDIGLRQLFLGDPSGVKIELNFRVGPARG